MMARLTEIPIMEYVQRLQRRVRELESQKGRIDRWQFFKGLLWGVGITAPAAWYLLHRGGC